MKTRLLELAEEPGVWTPPGPETEVVDGDGYRVVVRGRSGTVERIRLGDDDVARALEETRQLARERGLERMVWWTGELSNPGRSGGPPDGPRPDARSGRPRPDDASPSRRAARAGGGDGGAARSPTWTSFLRALEVDWEAWGLDADARERRRARAPEHWEALAGDPRMEHYLALRRR